MMVHFERLADAWLTVLLALILSTVLTMILTAWLMRSMQRLAADREPGDE
jgi:putative effector of murein hydrolase LrgA (UPF0299 family)